MKTMLSLLMLAAVVLTAGCSPVPKRAESREVLDAQINEAIVRFKEEDPGIQRFFDQSAGYAVFPRVFKGAFWIGGAHGNGMLYEGTQATGYVSLSQATLGFSFGGEFFREIIFFRTTADIERFKIKDYTFSAQATAVAITAGAAAKADYRDGMAVFVMTDAGLMVDASVGGQKFNYVPMTVR